MISSRERLTGAAVAIALLTVTGVASAQSPGASGGESPAASMAAESPAASTAAESPAGGMTGAGIHVLDAFVHLIGPVHAVTAQLVTRKPPPDPTDMLSAMFSFTAGATGLFATLRSTPDYRRVHVFGRAGSVEAIGDTELIIRRSGKPVQMLRFDRVDSVRLELEAFADTVTGRQAYPITTDQMLSTITAFEALVTSAETGRSITC